MTVTVEMAFANDDAEPDNPGPPVRLDPAAAERQALIERWAERHGVDAAQRLAEAEDLADAVAAEITPENTTDTYTKSWRVWIRFCAATELPELEATRGSLVAFVTWMLREGRQTGKGYAPSSASTHLAAAVVGLRQRGVTVSGDDQAAARTALEGLAVKLLQNGERRGRGQAVGADVDGLRAIARACPDTLTGDRDKALTLTGFHYASRSQDPAGLLGGDVTLHPRGLVVAVLTGKTKHSVRNARSATPTTPRSARSVPGSHTAPASRPRPNSAGVAPKPPRSSASTGGATSPAAWDPTPSPARSESVLMAAAWRAGSRAARPGHGTAGRGTSARTVLFCSTGTSGSTSR
ncbi:integrase [Streptomyces parvus]|uniref:integrase n=1 Tax=Streptomyces parvus TaxID=66428 RepID=UPI0021CC6967|nr:integrase [Streptomyces parvus]